MTIYHLMGMGKSLGAVTSALSYVAARKKRNLPSDRAFLGRIDTHSALIVFTTPDIRNGAPLDKAEDFGANGTWNAILGNRANQLVPKYAGRYLRELNDGAATQDLYWCDVEREQPVKTFERISQVLQVLRSQLANEDQLWINLTGGSNVINGALQLAASMFNLPTRLYYLIGDEPSHAHHGFTDFDAEAHQHYWVDLPLVYLPFQERLQSVMTRAGATVPASTRSYETTLRDLLVRLFSVEEINTLCIDLGIDYENVPKRNGPKDAYVRELVGYCRKRSQLGELVVAARRERPREEIPFDPCDSVQMEQLILGVLNGKAQAPLSLAELYRIVCNVPHLSVDGATDLEKQANFENSVLAPLEAQRLIVMNASDRTVEIGANGKLFVDYLRVLNRLDRETPDTGVANLVALAQQKTGWFTCDAIQTSVNG